MFKRRSAGESVTFRMREALASQPLLEVAVIVRVPLLRSWILISEDGRSQFAIDFMPVVFTAMVPLRTGGGNCRAIRCLSGVSCTAAYCELCRRPWALDKGRIGKFVDNCSI